MRRSQPSPTLPERPPTREALPAGERLSPVLAGAVAAFVSVLITACGNGATEGADAGASDLSASSRPVDLPRGVVARVAGGEVTRAEFDRVYAARARGVARRGSGARGRVLREGLVAAAMSELIQSEVAVQRARAAGVSVSAARVYAALARAREPFDGAAQWRKFLKQTGQTEGQVRDRLRLALLNRRLYAHDRAESGDAAAAASVARRRLRAATECRRGYVVSLCSNSTSTPTEANR